MYDDIFLTLSHHDNLFCMFTLALSFSYMDTQVCPCEDLQNALGV